MPDPIDKSVKKLRKKVTEKTEAQRERQKAKKAAVRDAPASHFDRTKASEEARKKRAERVKEKLKGKKKADGTPYEFNPKYKEPQSGRCNALTSAGGYCGLWAGFRTDHPGVGRCWLHDRQSRDGVSKNQLKRHRRYSYLRNSKHVARLRQQEEEFEELLDLSPELRLMRVLLEDILENFDMWSEALEEWYLQEMPRNARPRNLVTLTEVMDALEKIGRQAERIQKMRTHELISVFVVHQYLELAGAQVVVAMQEEINDPVLADRIMEKIEDGWANLPLIEPSSTRVRKTAPND